MARVWPNDVPFQQNTEGTVFPQTYRPPQTASVEAGPDIMRRRPGPRSTIVPWRSIALTEAQAATLEQFFRETLLEGTLSFDMSVYRLGQGYVQRRCQIQSGTFNVDYNDYPVIWISFSLVIFNL